MDHEWQHRVARGELPTQYEALAARTAAQLIPDGGTEITTLHASYRSTATGGVFGTRSLVVGERLLIAAGLAQETEGRIVPLDALGELRADDDAQWCHSVLESLLAQGRPMWLAVAAGSGEVDWALVPDDASSALEFLPPEQREALLLSLGWRFTEGERERVGDLAEEHVVERMRALLDAAGRPDLAANVRRVSLISDALGYDVTVPALTRDTLRLEVKGTRAAGSDYVIYLSRNEANVGLRDPAWRLVVCAVGADDTVQTRGWLTGDEIAPLLPHDRSAQSAWHTVEIALSDDALHVGEPPLT